MTTTQTRQPAGIPVGGQFAAARRQEAPVELTVPTVIPDLIDLTPETQQVLDACRSAGGRPFIVGGAVRDALLARARGSVITPKDIDIEVHGISEQGLFDALPGEKGIHGVSFGIVNTKLGDQDFDVSLPRRENKNGSGYRGFAVELDPDMGTLEAFRRRDFTINAMGWDAETGEVIDHYGGQADLEAGILRHTSPAFTEEPMRVMRAIQFSGRFDLEIAPETLELCRFMKDQFPHLPKSHVWKHFHKMAGKAVKPSRSLEAIYATGLSEYFPALANVRGLTQDPVWHPEGAVDIHLGMAADAAAEVAERDGLDEDERAVIVLTAMLHDVGKAHFREVHPNGGISNHGHAEGGVEPARGFLKSIGAPKHVRDKVLPIIREHMCHTANSGNPSTVMVSRLMRRLENDVRGPSIEQWARVVDADLAGRGPGAKPPISGAWLEIAERLRANKSSDAILRGQHLMAAGIKPGFELGWIVKASIEAQDNGEFNDVDGALAWVEANRDSLLDSARVAAEAKAAERAAVKRPHGAVA